MYKYNRGDINFPAKSCYFLPERKRGKEMVADTTRTVNYYHYGNFAVDLRFAFSDSI